MGRQVIQTTGMRQTGTYQGFCRMCRSSNEWALLRAVQFESLIRRIRSGYRLRKKKHLKEALHFASVLVQMMVI